MSERDEWPREDGDVTVLGPEVFASLDGSVVCWRGENYVRQDAAAERDARWERLVETADGLLESLSQIDVVGPIGDIDEFEEARDDLADALAGARTDEPTQVADSGAVDNYKPEKLADA
jgi:hypothetical protein